MEKRIKLLYLITIIAILAFLGMQAYWLYGRYVFSLSEYESNLAAKIIECVDKYNNIRSFTNAYKPDSLENSTNEGIVIPRFTLSQHYADSVRTTRTATVLTYKTSARKLLGLDPEAQLTDEMLNEAMELAQEKYTPTDSMVYDASGAKDENEAWTAAKNIHIERNNPFTIEGIDTILNKAGIHAEISLAKADTMVWKIREEYRKSVLTPNISLTIPYSQLEGQTVNITCAINPFVVLPGMWHTLLISLVMSALLIACLILQFATVLKLSRLDRMHNSFISTMIHELKRPISTLKICVSGLDNDRILEDPEARKEMVAATRNALDNLSAYFSKLRDITFNNVEQIPLNLQNINLHTLMESVSTALVLPADKTVTIKNDIGEDVEVSADSSHLYNILNNLLENAIKYSGSAVEIRATASKKSDTVELQISDNGNGIASGDIRHIFKRFYRGKASTGDQPGMGLGLTYVKLLTEAHGGNISVESSEGKGTCFTIILPQ